MKLFLFILTVTLSLSVYSNENYELVLSELLLESESYDIARSLEEIIKISVIIEEEMPETIQFSRSINETAIKQLVYTLHSKGLTDYSYVYRDIDTGVIYRTTTF